jgi:hypothetical protein
VRATWVHPVGAVTLTELPPFTAILAIIKSPADTVGVLSVNSVIVAWVEDAVVGVPETIAAAAIVPMHKVATAATTETTPRCERMYEIKDVCIKGFANE